MKKKFKTTDEKFWEYLVKKLGATKTAKHIFNRVTKHFYSKTE
jgi:allantoicase